MDEPGNGPPGKRRPARAPADRSRAAARRGALALGDVTSRWHGDALRLGEETKRRLHELARELGLVTREEWDELELRVAQLEHRLRLLEDTERPVAALLP